MKLILALSVILIQVSLGYFLKIAEIVGTFRINTLVDSKMFTILDLNQRVSAVRTFEDSGLGKAVIVGRRKVSLTDLTAELALLFSIVPGKIPGRGMTLRTGAFFGHSRDTVMPEHRFYQLTVTFLVIADKVLPVPVLSEEYDFRKFINLKLLILGRMRIIKGPLLQGNVSADEVQ